jgi:short chain dehydrogenase
VNSGLAGSLGEMVADEQCRCLSLASQPRQPTTFLFQSKIWAAPVRAVHRERLTASSLPSWPRLCLISSLVDNASSGSGLQPHFCQEGRLTLTGELQRQRCASCSVHRCVPNSLTLPVPCRRKSAICNPPSLILQFGIIMNLISDALYPCEDRKTWLIVGASRGIGLEFVHQLLQRGEKVIATVRQPFAAHASALWGQAGSDSGRCQMFICDVLSEASIVVCLTHHF